MKQTITPLNNITAEQVILKDLMNTFIAEQFFTIDEQTDNRLSDAPNSIQHLFSGYEQSFVYIGEICFLIKNSYRQGWQWVTGSPIYIKEKGDWLEISSPLKLSQLVLRYALSEEAYLHPGVTYFLHGLKVSIQQLHLSMKQMEDNQLITPNSPYDWFVKGEMIASLRDRPFHPLSKAKIGFTPENYQAYMAEFGQPTTLYWVAISNESIVKGCQEEEMESLDVLNDEQKAVIEKELALKGLSKEKYTVIPVHPWQLHQVILQDFKKEIGDQTIIILDSKAGDFLATSSVRSLISPYESMKMLKLPISVKSLGAARYLPVVKLLNGIAGEQMFRQAIACDKTLADRVFLCEEKHWWGYMPETLGLFDDHPRHLAAQVRVYPQEIMKKEYKIIPMASLGVVMQDRHFLTEIIGENVTNEDVIHFYADLAALFYDITMRLFKIGIVPEIHGQNCCVVLKHNKIVGLLFRDHDSVRLHQPYLDRHQIKDPGYYIRPGYSNSLYNETIEKLIYYVQSLGTQVNLAAIMESLSNVYTIPEKRLWQITEAKLRESLQTIDIPEADREILHYELFENKQWPVKLIIRPLLEADGVPGAMPSGKGVGHNPFYPALTGSKTPVSSRRKEKEDKRGINCP
ncbi:IucA/IucC family protein [Domibacillus mangrovi]|uniref:IucA/IucC family protein n=1 Tax=Domibacillus mangrovi TaxID=1714354 RepID=UPI0009F9E09D